MTALPISVGQRIRVTQEVDRREGNWQLAVEGTVESVKPEKTGSWYAHGKDDKFWLYRIRVRKPDGELSTLIVDQNSRVEFIPDRPA